jgi:hypothetical protein
MKSNKTSVGSATPNQNLAATEIRGFIVGIGSERPNATYHRPATGGEAGR